MVSLSRPILIIMIQPGHMIATGLCQFNKQRRSMAYAKKIDVVLCIISVFFMMSCRYIFYIDNHRLSNNFLQIFRRHDDIMDSGLDSTVNHHPSHWAISQRRTLSKESRNGDGMSFFHLQQQDTSNLQRNSARRLFY